MSHLQALLEVSPEVFYGAKIGAVGRPGEDGVLLPLEISLDLVGSVNSSAILLEDDALEVVVVV